MSDQVVNYSATDRFLHRFALRNPWLQRTMADIEDRIFSSTSATEAGRPVFITALPRSGTTLLLNICAASGRFATHTYRDMPFVLAPLLWNRLSGPFRQRGTRRERAHGDGVDVDFDSAEAFEEVLWLAFWQQHFTGERIRLWEADEVDEDGEFPEFFRRHMGKLIALRSAGDPGGAEKRRYLSKNNANIARLGWLRRHFPDCRIVIPFRRPDTHIRSLMSQHERFSHLHGNDPFARDYMSLIGHFEFGAALRPIGFDGVPAVPEAPDAPGAREFWPRYWVAAYRHILTTADDTMTFLPYESLCETPGEFLPRLAAALDLPLSAFDASVAGIRPLPKRPDAGLDLPVSLREETENLHRLLVERSKRCLFAESVE